MAALPSAAMHTLAQAVNTKGKTKHKAGVKIMLDKISLVLVIVGALNWGSIGLFQFDLVAYLFGGQGAMLSRIVYTLVALAGIWAITLLFRDDSAAR